MPAKSWMPLWLAMVCAVGAWLAATLLHHVAITQFAEHDYLLALDVWMLIVVAMPIFWLMSYMRYNQLAHIKRLPLLLLLVWSLPVLIVLHAVAKSDPILEGVYAGCMVLWILAGCIEVYRNRRNKSKEPIGGL